MPIVNVPTGKLISKIARTQWLCRPRSSDTIVVDFLPLLELAWIEKKLMMKSSTYIFNRPYAVNKSKEKKKFHVY